MGSMKPGVPILEGCGGIAPGATSQRGPGMYLEQQPPTSGHLCAWAGAHEPPSWAAWAPNGAGNWMESYYLRMLSGARAFHAGPDNFVSRRWQPEPRYEQTPPNPVKPAAPEVCLEIILLLCNLLLLISAKLPGLYAATNLHANPCLCFRYVACTLDRTSAWGGSAQLAETSMQAFERNPGLSAMSLSACFLHFTGRHIGFVTISHFRLWALLPLLLDVAIAI